MLNDLSSPLTLLATRRSGKPREMIAPGPDAKQLDTILTIAARTPDHKKLAPWRFVVIENREKFADLLADAFRAERAAAEGVDLGKLTAFAHDAPTLIAVMSRPDAESRVPLWEQELSAGAACMNLPGIGIRRGVDHRLGGVLPDRRCRTGRTRRADRGLRVHRHGGRAPRRPAPPAARHGRAPLGG